jgi:phage gp45-like
VTTQTLYIDASAAVNIKTQTLTIDASTAVNANTPAVNASQQVSVAGALAANGGIAAQAGSGGGAAVAISDKVNVTQDVVINGKSVIGHDHRDSVGGTTSKLL